MVKKATTKSRTSTRTKEELQHDLSDLKNQISSQEEFDRVTANAAKLKEAEIRKAVENLSVEKAAQSVTQVSLEISKALASVTEQVMKQAQELENVNKAVELAKKELEELHGKEIVASSIAELLTQQESTQKEYELKLKQLEEDFVKLKVAEQKAAEERKAELVKERAREQKDYEYNTMLARRKQTDEFEATLAKVQKDFAEKNEFLVKDWEKRENELRSKEQELEQLRETVKAHPAVIQTEITKAVAATKANLEKDWAVKLQLQEKDAQAAKALADQTIKSLEVSKTELSRTVESLRAQLTESEKRVSEIASKALESASGQVALEKLTSFSRSSELNAKKQ